METGKFSDSLRVTENRLVSGADRAFKSANSTFQNISDRLNQLGKSVDFDILFLGPPSGIFLTRVHFDIKILVPWKWDRFPVFRVLAQNIFQFLVRDDTEIACHYMATCSVWKFRITSGTRCGVLGKDHRSLLAADLLCNWKFLKQPNGYSYKKCLAIK